MPYADYGVAFASDLICINTKNITDIGEDKITVTNERGAEAHITGLTQAGCESAKKAKKEIKDDPQKEIYITNSIIAEEKLPQLESCLSEIRSACFKYMSMRAIGLDASESYLNEMNKIKEKYDNEIYLLATKCLNNPRGYMC